MYLGDIIVKPLTIPEMIIQNCQTYSNKPAFYIKEQGAYHPYSYHWMLEQISSLGYALHHMSTGSHLKAAILSENRVEWILTDIAVMGIGGIVIPIYPTLTPEQIRFILLDSGTELIFVSNKHQLDKIMEIFDEVPSLIHIITYDEMDMQLPDYVSSYRSFLEQHPIDDTRSIEFYNQQVRSLDPQATTTIVYTSGTTGNPKGVMLHQQGLMHDIINAESVLPLNDNDIFLSFLPLSHLYERIAGHYCCLWRGGAVAYAESIETVVDNISEVKPTVIVGVPRFYEKVATRIQHAFREAGGIKRFLAEHALAFGQSWFQKPDFKQKLKNRLLFNVYNKIVYQKIIQRLGGNIRYLISGGAPLSPEVLRFFVSIGLTLVEGYGLTETHLIVTLTPPGKSRYGSCGQPIPGVNVKIAEDGEILISGPTIMKGYYNQPELTKDVIDHDGWFHSGDIGYLDEDNYLFITGRKKHIIVTSGGKNIAPQPVEDALKQSPYIADAVLVGNGRKFPLAMIVPDLKSLQRFCTSQQIEYTSLSELIRHPQIQDLYQSEIDQAQQHLARYEKAKQFIIMDELPTIENGFMTPSLKLRREKIEEAYKHQINAVYEQFK
ncbi:MAG: AMP-dependent synthetase/ligase [Calditrichia bacterium]